MARQPRPQPMEREIRPKPPFNFSNNGDTLTIEINLPQVPSSPTSSISGNFALSFITQRQDSSSKSTPAPSPALSPLSWSQASSGCPSPLLPSKAPVTSSQAPQSGEHQPSHTSQVEHQEHQETQQQFVIPFLLGWILSMTFLALFIICTPGNIMSIFSNSAQGVLAKGLEALRTYLPASETKDAKSDPEKGESWDTFSIPVNFVRDAKNDRCYSPTYQEQTAIPMDTKQNLEQHDSNSNMTEFALPQPMMEDPNWHNNHPGLLSRTPYQADLGSEKFEEVSPRASTAAATTVSMTGADLFDPLPIQCEGKLRGERTLINFTDRNDIGPPPVDQRPEAYSRLRLPSIHTIVHGLPSPYSPSYNLPSALLPPSKEGEALSLTDMEYGNDQLQEVKKAWFASRLHSPPSPFDNESSPKKTTGTRPFISTKPSLSALLTTTNTTNPMTTHSCRICGNCYATASNLRRHEREHDDSLLRMKFQCRKCRRGFTQASSLKRHIMAIHESRTMTDMPLGFVHGANRRTTKFG